MLPSLVETFLQENYIHNAHSTCPLNLVVIQSKRLEFYTFDWLIKSYLYSKNLICKKDYQVITKECGAKKKNNGA